MRLIQVLPYTKVSVKKYVRKTVFPTFHTCKPSITS